MTKPIYHRGMKIDKVIDALALIMAGGVFYIPGGNNGWKTVPSAFIQNWSIRQLTVAVNSGRLYLAEKTSPPVP